MRVKLLQIERALTARLVPWQYVEVAMLPIRRRYAMRHEHVDAENSDQPGCLPV
ncbi:hypothetical protein [Dictyobacter vulcani]|uniref:hypothetical protein n=1 Tax=Dictyobacter vulcani TaxID=2607529 RepID=UPI001386DD7B|nr:hypothetical protein [Dictyobacter vulcani]